MPNRMLLPYDAIIPILLEFLNSPRVKLPQREIYGCN